MSDTFSSRSRPGAVRGAELQQPPSAQPALRRGRRVWTNARLHAVAACPSVTRRILQSARCPPAILPGLRGFNVVSPKTVGWPTQSRKLSNFAQTHRADRHTISGSDREEVGRSARSKGSGHHSLETERSYSIVICLPAVGAWAASDRPAEAIHRLGRPHRSRGNPGQIAQACRRRRYRLKLAPERSSPSLLSTLMGLIRTSAPAIAQRSARTARRASMAADAAAVVDG